MNSSFLSRFALVVVFVMMAGAFSAVADDDHRLTGREIVKIGEFGAVSGPLFERDGEWFIQTESEVFEIHLGNHDYRKQLGISLKEGKPAQAQGFIKGKDVAVTTLTVDGKEFRFRKDDGEPMWAGRSQGKGSGKIRDDKARSAGTGRGRKKDAESQPEKQLSAESECQ